MYLIPRIWTQNQGILDLGKSLSRAPTWPNYVYTEFFHCDIKEQYKIWKTCPGFLFLILDLEKITFFMFSVPCKKKQSYFIWLVWANTSSLWKSRTRFCAAVMFLGICKVSKNLEKIYWSWSSSKIKL